MIRIFVSLVFAIWSATAALADIRTDVRNLFASDLETLDFARVKIEVDRMIDPSIDVDHSNTTHIVLRVQLAKGAF